MCDILAGDAYNQWITGELDYVTFWQIIQRRAAVSLGKSWDQYCAEMKPIEPLDWPEPLENPSETQPTPLRDW